MSLLTLRGLFERLRAPSQSQKGHFSEKMKLKKWHQNSWNWQKSAQSLDIFVTPRGICQSVGVSSRKGEHFPFWTKMVRTKIKPDLSPTIFPRKWSSRNDTKTPGTGKSLLSPRKYSWRLVAFVKAWEWAREKVSNFHFGQKMVRTKIKPVLAVRNDLTDTESRREVSLHDNFVRIQKLNLYSYFKSLVCTLIVIQTALSFFQKHIQPIYFQWISKLQIYLCCRLLQ